MPELPEVETIRTDLHKRLRGQSIRSLKILDQRVLGNPAAQFTASLKGRRIAFVSRRGKAVMIHLDNNDILMVHLKMTGQLIYADALDHVLVKETKVIFLLTNNHVLVYNDQRVFGRLTIVPDMADNAFLNSIGPEPLEKTLSVSWLKQQLAKRVMPIKPLLMDQAFLAGIGNIYASEILFHARVLPQRKACALTDEEIKRLRASIKKILTEAIKWRGCSMRNYRDSAGAKGLFMDRIKVYAREEKSCVRCKAPIMKIVQSGRSTFYCNRCQH